MGVDYDPVSGFGIYLSTYKDVFIKNKIITGKEDIDMMGEKICKRIVCND
jgi:hypothetical protein